ncbi:MAG: hypothetical protein KGY99_05150 [Phycisphaerae bacterium]|nr:hypothetical protein [Phycisphaerae bacterium]
MDLGEEPGQNEDTHVLPSQGALAGVNPEDSDATPRRPKPDGDAAQPSTPSMPPSRRRLTPVVVLVVAAILLGCGLVVLLLKLL